MEEDIDDELHEFVFPQKKGTRKSMFLTLESFADLFKSWQDELNPRKPIEEVEFVWCLVGNIIEKHYFGEEKKVVSGSKHFRANTKMYCVLPPWNDFLPKYSHNWISKKRSQINFSNYSKRLCY